MGMKNFFTTTHHPQTKGQVEGFNRTLVDMLGYYVEEHQEDRDKLLAILSLTYNSRVHRTTGVAPLDFVTPRLLTKFSLERIPNGLEPGPKPGPKAKDELLE